MWFKIGLKEFRIQLEVRGRIKLPGLYQMSEDGVYPSSVPSCPYWGIKEFEDDSSRSNVVVDVSRSSIGVVLCVNHVVQNWFKGIPNPTRSSRKN